MQIECATTIICAKNKAFLIFTTRIIYIFICMYLYWEYYYYCVYWNCMNIEHAYHFHCNTLFKHILLYFLMKDRRKSQYTECFHKMQKERTSFAPFFCKEMILNLWINSTHQRAINSLFQLSLSILGLNKKLWF